jgi:hypothetical protein
MISVRFDSKPIHLQFCSLICSFTCGAAAFHLWPLCLVQNVAASGIDADPSNNLQATADALPLSPGTAIANRAALVSPGNDVDFFSVALTTGDVLFGMTTPIADVPTTFDVPDTMAAVLSGGVYQTFDDDDFADELPNAGINLGSLFRYQATTTGPHHIGITGFGDYGFDGPDSGNSHSETGDYILTVGHIDPAVLGGDFEDTDPANDLSSGADLITLNPLTSAAVAVSELLDADVDFYEIRLSAGHVLSAMTAPLDDLSVSFDFPDTVLGLFDSNLTPLVANDDAGDFLHEEFPDLASDNPFDFGVFGSAIRAVIPADGVYYLGVTGFEDDNFLGDHIELGRYALLVSAIVIPEPSTFILQVISLYYVVIATASRRRRRTTGSFRFQQY